MAGHDKRNRKPADGLNRRSFVLLTAGGMTGGMTGFSLSAGPAGATAATSAAARIGQRIQATLPADVLAQLRAVASGLAALPAPTLVTQIAADHRAGRIVKVEGVSLALSEAAFCLSATEAGGLS